MMNISREIMQLPLSLGGLSLRLPSETLHIAYAASCGECIPHLHNASARLGFSFDGNSLHGLEAARIAVTRQLEGYLIHKPDDIISFEHSDPLSDPSPLQEQLTTLLIRLDSWEGDFFDIRGEVVRFTDKLT
jgi:hypothetical protein